MLTVLETHPVQYHAPVYRYLAQSCGVCVSAVYGSDFSVAGYQDAEFGTQVAWDTDLLSGYPHQFLSHRATGGAASYDEVVPAGLLPAVQGIQPNALMVLGYWHPFDRAAIQVARQLGLPLFFRGETNDAAVNRAWWKALIRDLMLRRLYARCQALLYVGQRSLHHYQRLGARPDQLFFSPYCVDASTFSPGDDSLRRSTRERLGISPDKTVLMFSGKLSDRKGVDLIPAAVNTLPPSLRRRVHLLFLGDGALRESLEAACAGLSSSFVGFQNQSALSSFYLAADALLLPSRQLETWGLVVNEAMLHGLPCIVSDRVGSQPDLVLPGDTGEVCQAGDAESLAQAITKLLSRIHDDGLATRCQHLVSTYSVAAAAQGIARAWQGMSKKGKK